MSFTICHAEQRSDEWFAARAGRLTGSTAKEMLTPPRSKKDAESTARRKLRVRLALERINQRVVGASGFQSAAMLQGVEREHEARLFTRPATAFLSQKPGF